MDALIVLCPFEPLHLHTDRARSCITCAYSVTSFRHHPALLHTTTTMSTTIVPAATKEGLSKTEVDARSIRSRDASSADDDDRLLVDQFGYVPSFKREFSSLATVCARTVSPSTPTLTH